MNKEFTMGDAFILADVITRAKTLEGSEKMTVDISMIDIDPVSLFNCFNTKVGITFLFIVYYKVIESLY